MRHERTNFGLAAENAVAEQLKTKGFRILDRNWRRPWGELDIVAEQEGIIHFVEVKASSSSVAGFEPYRRASASKMHKVRRTARTWLSDHGYGPDTPWQTDIASVIGTAKDLEIELFFNE
jgi:putative endonuclease